jgi:hypothetical protein
LTAIFLANQLDARFEPADDFRSTVGGTVVHHNDFKTILRIVLLQHTAQSLFYEAVVIVGVNQNAKEHVCENFRSTPMLGCRPRVSVESAGETV